MGLPGAGRMAGLSPRDFLAIERTRPSVDELGVALPTPLDDRTHVILERVTPVERCAAQPVLVYGISI